MNFKTKYIDELIAIRKEAREEKNWKLSDDIRDYLDTKHIFVFDTPNDQLVYHRKEGSRKDIIEQIRKGQRAQNLFDAWLYSMNISVEQSLLK